MSGMNSARGTLHGSIDMLFFAPHGAAGTGRGSFEGQILKHVANQHDAGGNVNCLLVLNAGNGWQWGNGIIIHNYYGSFPHSLQAPVRLFAEQKLC